MKAAERFLAWIADRCREAYIYERTQFELSRNKKLQDRRPPYQYRPAVRWDGGEDDEGREFAPYWPKLASFMLAHGLEPEAVIRKRFMLVKGANPPWPNQIAVEAYLEQYKGLSELASEDEIAVAYRLDKEYMRTAMSSSRYFRPDKSHDWSMTALLLDNSLDVSALMRFCVAHEMKLRPVMNRLERRAIAQVIRAPKAHSKVWGKAIPEEILQAAAVILRGSRDGR